MSLRAEGWEVKPLLDGSLCPLLDLRCIPVLKATSETLEAFPASCTLHPLQTVRAVWIH